MAKDNNSEQRWNFIYTLMQDTQRTAGQEQDRTPEDDSDKNISDYQPGHTKLRSSRPLTRLWVQLRTRAACLTRPFVLHMFFLSIK